MTYRHILTMCPFFIKAPTDSYDTFQALTSMIQPLLTEELIRQKVLGSYEDFYVTGTICGSE